MKKHAFSSDSKTLFDDVQYKDAPLSARMRPRSLEEFSGQTHVVAEDKILVRSLKAGRLSSIILYGPPGCGKTTLAHCISRHVQGAFEQLNAVSSNVEDLRKVIAASRMRRSNTGSKTVLFLDEIHRFNKAQQDVLMPDLEEGHLILIGATVFNPFFSLISPLISRSLVFELSPLSPEDIRSILQRAILDAERGMGFLNIHIEDDAMDFLSRVCEGDARKALNALEIGCLTTPQSSDGTVVLTLKEAQESIQKKHVRYDRDGDGHYDTASVFIKSMRGSDPDAAIYWMAKMIYAGEDPRFIARRICICAAEDVGNADPRALLVANAAMQSAEFLGLPEARIPLAQAAIYVACAPKSNASYLAIDKALDDVKNNKVHEVPVALKDASYKGAGKLGHGKDYKYSHDYDNHYVQQTYAPLDVTYYVPGDQGYEQQIKKHMAFLRSISGEP